MHEQEKLILIAEDDENLRLLAVKQLFNLGYVGYAVKDGTEAVKEARKVPYKMILMDVQMPEMDGLQASREIRRAESELHLPRVPIVAMTANPNRELCLAAGMDDFLFKPVMAEHLRNLFKKWSLLE
jgi:two-component system, sensor histidine kinase and response regulator